MKRKHKKGKQGFASMSLEARREIASLGGIKAHQLGKAHVFSKEEASLAAKKGWKRVGVKKRMQKRKENKLEKLYAVE